MCPLCGALLSEHWSDPEGISARRSRILRTAMIRRVLHSYSVTMSDWGGSAYVLHDGKGHSAAVHDLSTMWDQAERMAGRPLDPLDPALIAALRCDG
jgi:hypothetical protein